MPWLKTHEMLLVATGASGESSTAAVRDIILREHVHCRESFNREKKQKKKRKKHWVKQLCHKPLFQQNKLATLE
jgi:hypothetical protein